MTESVSAPAVVLPLPTVLRHGAQTWVRSYAYVSLDAPCRLHAALPPSLACPRHPRNP